MDRRKLARRKQKVAEIREREAQVAFQLAQKSARDKEQEIVALRESHEKAESDFHQSNLAMDGAWLDVVERSRESHRKSMDRLQRELALRNEHCESMRVIHVSTLEIFKSSEKVTDKVVLEWKKEALVKESKELDEVGNILMKRKSEERSKE